MEPGVMSKMKSTSLDNHTTGGTTVGISIKTEDGDWPEESLALGQHSHGHGTTHSAALAESQTHDVKTIWSKGISDGASASADNFLGVGKNRDMGVNNFLGVRENGEVSLSTVSFLAVGGSGDLRDGFTDIVENAKIYPGADSFLHAGQNVYQDSDSVFKSDDNPYPDPDTFHMSGQNSFPEAEDHFIEIRNSKADEFVVASDDVEDLMGSVKNTHSNKGSFPGAIKPAHHGTDNFLGVGHEGNIAQGPDSFLGTGVAKNKRDAQQDSEPWVEVKIEIDVADTEFVTEPIVQTNSFTTTDSPMNHRSHRKTDSLDPVNREKEVMAGICHSPDDNYCGLKHGDRPQRGEQSAQSQGVSSCNTHNAGLQPMVPWQIKVEPDSDNSLDCSAVGEEEAGVGGGRGVSTDDQVTSTWSSVSVHSTGRLDMDQGDSRHGSTADSMTTTQTADSVVPDLTPDLHIKKEPGQQPAHVVGTTDFLHHHRQSAGVSASTSCLPEASSEHTNFVIKMEPESDQETVIDGMTDCSQEEFGSCTEDEGVCVTKPQLVSKILKKSLTRLEKPRPYQCQYCDSTFVKKSRLREHTRTHTDERPYKCQECNISFRKAESLKVHTRTHTGELPFQCQDCSSAFKCSQELKRHTIRKHLAVRPFSCPECQARFFSQADLRGHQRVHTGEKPYKCSDCHAAFRKSSALTCHMRIHTGQKPYACSQCDRTFRRSDQLKRHMKLHTGEKPFACNECDGAFTCTSDLKKHIARKHSLIKPFSCPECGNKFFTNEDLKMHRIFHMGIKPHACSECGAAFVRASDLKVHMRIHTGEKPFSCDICSATFARSGDLRLHVRMHEDKRPFTCSICNLSFRRSGHLTRHMNTHNGQKSFSCEDCNAAFFTSSDLKRHASRVHKKDVSKFACTQCDARFFTSRALSIHRMKHTGEKPFPCSICGAAFSHRDLLTSHMEVHGGEAESCKAKPAMPGTDQFMYIDISMITAQQNAGSNSHSLDLSSVQHNS
ncbi:uncharacterized protein LOC143277901 [Babylonia areolata]|uniref:uncharacterized protein LOC143277901 n=1 Tax=Babylonia areolata TaxID=304850 RepID=UPI003FCF2CB2